MFWTCFNVDMFQHPPPPSKKGHAQTWKYSNMDMFQHGNVPTWKCCIILYAQLQSGHVPTWTFSNMELLSYLSMDNVQHGHVSILLVCCPTPTLEQKKHCEKV